MRSVLCVFIAIAMLVLMFMAPLQQGHAVALTAVVVSAVIAAMAAVGIGMVVSGMTSAQIQDWVSGKLDTWSNQVGQSIEDLIPSTGIGVTISGLLVLGTAAAQGIKNFVNWLKTDEVLTDNMDKVVLVNAGNFARGNDYLYPTYQYNGREYYDNGFVWQYGLSLSTIETNGADLTATKFIFYTADLQDYAVAIYQSGSNMGYILIAHNSFSGLRYFGGASNNGTGRKQATTFTSAHHNTSTNYYISQVAAAFQPNPNVPIYTNINDAFAAYENIDYGSSLALRTGVTSVPQINSDEKWYLDVEAPAGSSVVEVSNQIMADTVANNLAASGTVAADEPTIDINGPIPVQGLQEVFPFCIPFDLYNLVGVLAADPVAPVINWRFYVPGICDETIQIDLSQFDTVASVCRKMELLLFCVGLAFVTRHLLRS